MEESLEIEREAAKTGGTPDLFRSSDNGLVDIRSIFKSISLTELIDRLEELQREFTMNMEDIVYLYLYVTYNGTLSKDIEQIVEQLRTVSKTRFPSKEIIRVRFNSFVNRITDEAARVKESIDAFNSVAKELDKCKPETYPINIEEKMLELSIDVKADLASIFDNLKVSNALPYIHLHNEGTDWYKIYPIFSPPIEWLKTETIGITLKTALGHRILWKPDNTVVVNVVISAGTEESVVDLLKASLQLNYRILSQKEVSIKCSYQQPGWINRAIFADLIVTRPIFRAFLFYSEFSTMYRSILNKRFTIYYRPNQKYSIPNSLRITITLLPNQSISLRVSKAASVKDVENFQHVFSCLLNIYKQQETEIRQEYRILLSSSEKLIKAFDQGRVAVKEDEKSGKRLQDLKQQRPYYFRNGYASYCQPKDHQPYIIKEEDMEKFKEKVRKNLGSDVNWRDLVLKFPESNGDTYACYPRETDDEHKGFIWPGFRKNNIKTGSYKEEVPFFPCCYSQNQYTKTGSQLYRAKQSTTVKKSDHIFGSTKRLPQDRYGNVPYNIEYIIQRAGYDQVTKGKQTVYPLLRYGVMDSGDSILHCLEQATNKRYQIVGDAKKNEIVAKRRNQLSKLSNFNMARQELYDIDDPATLLQTLEYLDAGLWIRVLEKYYNCQLLLLGISEQSKYGAIVLPRHTKEYIPPQLSSDKRSFVVFGYQLGTGNNQYELLVDIVRNSFDFANTRFLKELNRMVESSHRVFYSSLNKIVRYRPVSSEFFQAAIGQYIDQSGKLRALRFENEVTLITPPLPPLDLDLVTELTFATMENVQKFIDSRGLKIRYQDLDVNRRLQGVWVEFISYCYIPVEPIDALEGVDRSDHLTDSLTVEGSSKLQQSHLARQIAQNLQQRTLYNYAKDPGVFGLDSFIIDPDHRYSKLSQVFSDTLGIEKEGKIIVQSKDIRNRLMFYLKNRLLNDASSVLDYRNLELMKDYYRTVFDFKSDPTCYIFLDREGIEQWLSRDQSRDTIFNQPKIDAKEPYFYKNLKINDGKVYMIQNVEDGERGRALTVAYKWSRDKVNTGYLTEDENINEEYTVYSVNGKIKGVGDQLLLFQYYNQSFAALLPV